VTSKAERTPRLLWAVGAYAVAMAYVEAAVVVYLRAVYGIEDLLRDLPPLPDRFTPVELGREGATLVMLLAVGWLAGRSRQARLGYAVFAFGLWDIFYYVWLYVLLGWPAGLLEWDLLFLIPLPWWGPVLSPVLIALLLVVGGGLAVARAARGEPLGVTARGWAVAGAGVLLALYVFMADAVGALPGGVEAVSRARPTRFDWPLFLLALAGMAAPLVEAWRREPGATAGDPS